MYNYEYDEDDNGLTLVDFIKLSFGHNKVGKIRFCVAFATIVVIVFLAIGVFYNGSQAKYTANFQYAIPSLSEKVDSNGIVTSVSYVDGTAFNVKSLTTLDNLSNAKKANSSFDSINVEKMFENTDLNSSFSGSGEYQYTISIKKKYFSSENQAKEFFNELVKLPIVKTSSLVKSIDNSLYLEKATSKDATLNMEINALIKQADHISTTYTNLIDSMSKNNKTKVVVDDKLVDINDLKVVAESQIKNLNLQLYLNEVEANHYVRNYSDPIVKAEIVNTYNNLLAEANELQIKIDNYNNILVAGNNLNAEKYVEIMDKKVDVDYQVHVYEGFVNSGVESPEFETKLANVVSVLKSITDELTNVQKNIYQDEANTIYFERNSIVTETGKISISVVLIISFVVGILAASILNIVLGYSKYKDEKYSGINNKKIDENNA